MISFSSSDTSPKAITNKDRPNGHPLTVLFHPDFNRRLRHRTGSADTPKGPLAGSGSPPYRRWGISPRPENACTMPAGCTQCKRPPADCCESGPLRKQRWPMQAAEDSAKLAKTDHRLLTNRRFRVRFGQSNFRKGAPCDFIIPRQPPLAAKSWWR